MIYITFSPNQNYNCQKKLIFPPRRLYVPTMLVVGLHGWILPPGAILVCDIFVYSEFLIHPILLLGASGKMRREILRGVKTGATVRRELSGIFRG